ncbi:L,D-transpeptidase [Catenulispora rubra]|uniref:L,D-transpeptidase n=1 Tax=Catenulispora rubra TaxID=280293 RepID=UPI001892516B|nr:L,D-transpeptidase [Catenulispora rubra]
MPENFDVPGTFDERLTAGAARLEQEAAVRSPIGVRARGDQRRRRHTATLAVAPVLVLAIAGAAGLTLRPSGGSRHDVSGPPPASSVQTSTRSTTPNTSAVTAGAIVDLGRHTMTVHDAQGKVVKTLPITAGIPAHPTKTGTFTVVGKKESEPISSVDGTNYNVHVSYYIDFGPHAPAIYAAPWQQPYVGRANATHGDIELNIGDAVWLYDHLTVGDTLQIESGTAS